ncbi:helix-turn-helix transcriptional regulator [Candidatus Nomurabacteria bacterium]|nr:helix-turn-helix transcriptional regulator [Candidatus Nomurabacteria bacterium]
MDTSINRPISARILNLIVDKELKAAQIIKELKIPKATYYRCMNSEREWSVGNLIKISDYFSVTLDYLIKGPPEQKFKTEEMFRQRERLEKEIAAMKSYLSPAVDLINKAAESKVDYGKKKK